MLASRIPTRSCLLLLLCVGGCGRGAEGLNVRPPRADVAAALVEAGANRWEIERALTSVEGEPREGMRFLVEHMPIEDLRSLSAEFLVENVRLAYAARDRAPWRAEIANEVFLNEVLPYASASEPRDGWRRTLFDALMPVVADCDTPSEAVCRLNETIWERFGIRYSMDRERPDQGPLRSIELGRASCTGVAIFLNAACRAVAVPARVVGISRWPHMPGNHTWVEFWDEGGWHFTGAMESDEPIDDTWFVEPTSLARESDPRHAIYAASYKWTGEPFPMSWARAVPVNGVNVTYRYAPGPNAQEHSR